MEPGPTKAHYLQSRDHLHLPITTPHCGQLRYYTSNMPRYPHNIHKTQHDFGLLSSQKSSLNHKHREKYNLGEGGL